MANNYGRFEGSYCEIYTVGPLDPDDEVSIIYRNVGNSLSTCHNVQVDLNLQIGTSFFAASVHHQNGRKT